MPTFSGIVCDRLTDGYQTLIDFFEDDSESSQISVSFWEKSVTPPGMSGGGENDTTTMRNETYRTKAPKRLLTLAECSATVAYNPALYDEILDTLILKNVWVRITWPDGSTLGFWGFVDEFTPNELTEGEQPDADIKIIPTNQDNDCVEAPPVYTAAA